MTTREKRYHERVKITKMYCANLSISPKLAEHFKKNPLKIRSDVIKFVTIKDENGNEVDAWDYVTAQENKEQAQSHSYVDAALNYIEATSGEPVTVTITKENHSGGD